MLKKSILAIALTLTLASVANAAPKQDRGMDGYTPTVSQAADEGLFDRAKGNIY